MSPVLIYPIGCTPSCCSAAANLSQLGFTLTDHPSSDVTHLFLDVPSFRSAGTLRCGLDIGSVLETLPKSVTVIGGNLTDCSVADYQKLDLLQDPFFVAENAAITAECAVMLAAQKMNTVLRNSPVLVIGWGRIGKHLSDLLKKIGCQVSVLARKASDRAMLQSLGFLPVSPEKLSDLLPGYRLILNTAPETVICRQQSALCRSCLKIDLASKPGIEGDDVISARGLPGLYAPESAGQLIAQTVMRTLEATV